MDQPKTCTVDEAAAKLGICRSAYFNAVKRGEVPGIRVGRRIVVPRLQLERLLSGEEWKIPRGAA